MGMGLIKRIAGIIASGAVGLGVIVAAISWYQMSPDERGAVLGTVWRVLAWLGITLVLPWATFFVTTAVSRRESNGAGASLVAGYTLANAALLAWLFGNSATGSTTAVVFVVLGLLVALAYNLLACDWIAERLA